MNFAMKSYILKALHLPIGLVDAVVAAPLLLARMQQHVTSYLGSVLPHVRTLRTLDHHRGTIVVVVVVVVVGRGCYRHNRHLVRVRGVTVVQRHFHYGGHATIYHGDRNVN